MDTEKGERKQIKPGVYPDLPREDYDAAAATGHSQLIEWMNGETTKSSRRLIIGNAFHKYVQLGDYSGYKQEYPSIDVDIDLVSKAGKEAFKIVQQDKGKNVLRLKEANLVDNMIKSLNTDKQFGIPFMKSQGSSELSLFGVISGKKTDRLFGPHETMFKGMIDKATDNFLWDVKTTHCTNEQEFKDSILKFNYDSQFAGYRELYFNRFNEYKPCAWLCVSTQPPYNVFVPMQGGRPLPGPYMLNCGLRQLDKMLTLFERYA